MTDTTTRIGDDTSLLTALLCWLRGHDWDTIEHEELSAEYDEPVAIRYEYTVPKKWECGRCGETSEPFESLQLVKE